MQKTLGTISRNLSGSKDCTNISVLLSLAYLLNFSTSESSVNI